MAPLSFIDDLRERTRRRTSPGTPGTPSGYSQAAREMGIELATLLRFLNGHNVAGVTIERIVAWMVAVSAPKPPRVRSLLRGADRALIGRPLSPREHQILAILSRGATYAQVQHELGLSELTVRNAVTKILAKLDAPNLVAAAARRPDPPASSF